MWNEKVTQDLGVAGLPLCPSCYHPDLLFSGEDHQRIWLCMKCGNFSTGVDSPVMIVADPDALDCHGNVEAMRKIRSVLLERQRPAERAAREQFQNRIKV